MPELIQHPIVHLLSTTLNKKHLCLPDEYSIFEAWYSLGYTISQPLIGAVLMPSLSTVHDKLLSSAMLTVTSLDIEAGKMANSKTDSV